MGERVTHIGLVGFGRVGKNLFRLLHDSADLRLEAVSDPTGLAALSYLLRFDTLLGRFPAPIAVEGDGLRIGRRSGLAMPRCILLQYQAELARRLAVSNTP